MRSPPNTKCISCGNRENAKLYRRRNNIFCANKLQFFARQSGVTQRAIDGPRLVYCQAVASVESNRNRRALADAEASGRNEAAEQIDLGGAVDTHLTDVARCNRGSITDVLVCMPLGDVSANMISRDEAAGVAPDKIHAIDPQKVHQNEHVRHNSRRCHQRLTSGWSARAALANANRSTLSKPSF